MVKTNKNIIIETIPSIRNSFIDNAHGNKYAISKSKIINKIATK
jgi:hypothetical protein